MPDAKEKTAVPRLRFPEFRDAGPWKVKRLGKLVKTVTPPTKLQTSEYLPSGQFPIIDQSPSDICGWTNDETALVRGDFPLVVFGDHTCTVKLAGGPFAQGADGIKILAPTPEIEARFLFLALQADPIEQKGYKRHFSTLKEKLIPFPRKDTGEQQKIADCLASLDELIRAEEGQLATLKDYKKGLMQQLFPAPGATTPRLRFPEFRDAGPWEVKRLGEIAESLTSLSGKTSKDFGHGNAFYVPYTNVYENVFVDPNKLERVDIGPNENQNTIRRGDILFTVSSETPDEAGMSSVVVHDISNCYVNSFCTIYRPIQNIRLNTFFAGYYLRSPIVRDHFLKTAQGAIRFNLNREAFQKTPFLLPRLPEQQKIADCLSSLDGLIQAKSERIDALKQHKKGLMQQLFPQEVV